MALLVSALSVPQLNLQQVIGKHQLRAASHREAPITALDQKAPITDWFTFVSPEPPDKVVMILNVDPFLEPSNGPNYFPFDPAIRYAMLIDNDQNALPDVIFEFRFKTEVRLPGVFTALQRRRDFE
jgi:hypothetical protein